MYPSDLSVLRKSTLVLTASLFLPLYNQTEFQALALVELDFQSLGGSSVRCSVYFGLL